MKKLVLVGSVIGLLMIANGCTRIVKLSPQSGPPGTFVKMTYENTWGDPGTCTVYWDGKKICDPFIGCFTVPPSAKNGSHNVMLVDKLDASEAYLIFPVFRPRVAFSSFKVTE